jgi:hypothetical protein
MEAPVAPRARAPVAGAVARAVVFALALGGLGCERGCLSAWLVDHGVGGGSPAGSAARDRASDLDLAGTDCADGLARCVGGSVEVSRLAHVPHPCAAPGDRPGACACPWDVAARCAEGCAGEGVEVLAAAPIAVAQLCRPNEPVVRPLGLADPAEEGVCSDREIACKRGRIVTCDAAGQPPRAVAACLHGCAFSIGLSSDHGAAPTLDGAAAILCRRRDAERR